MVTALFSVVEMPNRMFQRAVMINAKRRVRGLRLVLSVTPGGGFLSTTTSAGRAWT
jgi:hypothetical protein